MGYKIAFGLVDVNCNEFSKQKLLDTAEHNYKLLQILHYFFLASWSVYIHKITQNSRMYFDKIYRVDKVRVKGKVIRFCKELIAVGAYF